MIDESKYIFRRATIEDISFIVDVIVNAEKGGTEKFGFANLFGMSEQEARCMLNEMLEEEIDGCEFSISSFIIAEYEGVPVSAFAGWIEGENEDSMPSSLLKSNLIAYYLPKDCLENSMARADAVKDLQIERELGTYQLEYSYTISEHRGHGLVGKIIEEHCRVARQSGKDVSRMYVHTFVNNESAVAVYKKSGFHEVQKFVSDSPKAKEYYPYNEVILLEKNI